MTGNDQYQRLRRVLASFFMPKIKLNQLKAFYETKIKAIGKRFKNISFQVYCTL